MFLGCPGVGRKRTLVQRDLISAQIAEQTSLINPRSFADLPRPLPANLTRVSIRTVSFLSLRRDRDRNSHYRVQTFAEILVYFYSSI